MSQNRTITPDMFTQVNNDINGNPRHVIHFINLGDNYAATVKWTNKLGGRKFHNKQYGGGILFYGDPEQICRKLNESLGQNTYKIKFIGRLVGSIGATFKISETVVAENLKAAKLKLCEQYEHISIVSVKENGNIVRLTDEL